jgi:hypothetical protein
LALSNLSPISFLWHFLLRKIVYFFGSAYEVLFSYIHRSVPKSICLDFSAAAVVPVVIWICFSEIWLDDSVGFFRSKAAEGIGHSHDPSLSF